MIGRRRAFAIGCVIYGLGSLTAALAPKLTVLVIGWSVLEGIGAALTTSFLQGVQANPAVPEQVKSQATVQLAGGVTFLSDVALQDALTQARVNPAVTEAALDANRQARGRRAPISAVGTRADRAHRVVRRPTRPARARHGCLAGRHGRG